MNVDIKGNAEVVKHFCKGIDIEKIWATCRLARSLGVHLEVTTLVIPTVNDSTPSIWEIAVRLAQELGPETPWHVSGYYPSYHFTEPPTPVNVLERAWQIAKDTGLRYVYVGNVPGHQFDSTYCPSCNTLLIERLGFDVLSNHIDTGSCPNCGQTIPGVW
jgi:pyruvate formate lyase activating enzyme